MGEKKIGILAPKTEQEQIRAKINHLASFPQLNPNPVIEIDVNGKVTFSNYAAIEFLQRLGLAKRIDLFFPEDFSRILKCLRAGKKKEFNREVRIGDSAFLETVTVLPELQVVRIYARDITEREHAEAKLKETRDYLENLIGYANAPIIVWDRSLRITRFNRAFERLTGYKSAEVIGKKLNILFPKAAKEPILAKIRSLATGKRWESVEIPIRCKNSDARIVLWNSANIYQGKGALLSTIAQGQDITERKKAEELLLKAHDELEAKVLYRTQELIETNKRLVQEVSVRKETEHQLSARNVLLKLLNNSVSRKAYLEGAAKLIRNWSRCRHAGIRVLNEEGYIPYESYVALSENFRKSESFLSVKEEQCVCTRVITGRPESEEKPYTSKAGSFYCGDTRAFLTKIPARSRHKFRGVCIKDGFRSLAVIPIRHRDKIIGAMHLADEEPERIEAKTREFFEALSTLIGEGIHRFDLEDKMHKEHTMLDAFFQHSIGPLVFLDRDFNFIRVNAAYAVICGKRPEEFIGHNHFELYPHQENEAIFREVVESKKPFQVFAKPFIFPDHPEWGVGYWDWTLVPILDQDNEVFLLVFSLNDVTQRKQQEERLAFAQRELEQARRLSDIGTLAATVAHELRNPLAAINLAASNIRRKAANPLLDKHLANIEKKVSESDQIISNLLYYSRIKPPHYVESDIYGILKECAGVKKSQFQCKIFFKAAKKGEKNFLLTADPLQMKEVFSNIINNACDAVPEKNGRIEILVKDAGDKIEVQVNDNGCGIEKEHLERVFDPFFTTKAKGTGLGLSVCQQIVKMHGGAIALKSEPQKGTSVTVSLPKKP